MPTMTDAFKRGATDRKQGRPYDDTPPSTVTKRRAWQTAYGRGFASAAPARAKRARTGEGGFGDDIPVQLRQPGMVYVNPVLPIPGTTKSIPSIPVRSTASSTSSPAPGGSPSKPTMSTEDATLAPSTTQPGTSQNALAIPPPAAASAASVSERAFGWLKENWKPVAVVGGIVLTGTIVFAVASRKKQEDEKGRNGRSVQPILPPPPSL